MPYPCTCPIAVRRSGQSPVHTGRTGIGIRPYLHLIGQHSLLFPGGIIGDVHQGIGQKRHVGKLAATPWRLVPDIARQVLHIDHNAHIVPAAIPCRLERRGEGGHCRIDHIRLFPPGQICPHIFAKRMMTGKPLQTDVLGIAALMQQRDGKGIVRRVAFAYAAWARAGSPW